MHASPHFHAAAHAFSTTRALTHRAALRACVRRQPAIYRTPAYSAGSRWPDLATSSQPLQTCRRPSVLASSVRFASGRSIISLLEVEWLIPMILSEPSDFHIHIHITCVYSLLFGTCACTACKRPVAHCSGRSMACCASWVWVGPCTRAAAGHGTLPAPMRYGYINLPLPSPPSYLLTHQPGCRTTSALLYLALSTLPCSTLLYLTLYTCTSQPGSYSHAPYAPTRQHTQTTAHLPPNSRSPQSQPHRCRLPPSPSSQPPP